MRHTPALVLLAMTAASRLTAGPLDPLNPPAPTPPIEPRVVLTETSQEISRAGSYVLGANLSAEAGQGGLRITAENVDLDLNGFTVEGNGSNANGIVIDGFNVTVHDGTVHGWGQSGILSRANRTRLNNLRLFNNNDGADLENREAVVTNCSIAANANGGLSMVDFSMVADCDFRDGVRGMNIGSNNLVRDCVLVGCVTGINTADGCTLRNLVVEDCDSGIGAGERSLVEGCNVSRGNRGVILDADCTMRDCVVSNPTLRAVEAQDRCVIQGNTLTGLGEAEANQGVECNGNRIRVLDNSISLFQVGVHITMGHSRTIIARNFFTTVGISSNATPSDAEGGSADIDSIATTTNPFANYVD